MRHYITKLTLHSKFSFFSNSNIPKLFIFDNIYSLFLVFKTVLLKTKKNEKTLSTSII